MIELTRAARVPGIGSEYGAFLYATISAGSNGTLLSVLSAMARMNLDPWQEAADLTALSAKAAARKLAILIAAVPGGPADSSENDAIAVRLVKLLPSQTRAILPPLPRQNDLANIRALVQSPTVRNVIFVLIAVALATVWFATHRAPSVAPRRCRPSPPAALSLESAGRP